MIKTKNNNGENIKTLFSNKLLIYLKRNKHLNFKY